MADITLSYKGSTIAEVSASGTTKLNTKGKFCEDDITLQYVKPSGGGSYVGGTVAWNQNVNDSNFDYSNKWSARYATVSVSGNIATMTPSSNGTERGIYEGGTKPSVFANHVYLLMIDCKPSVACGLNLTLSGGSTSVLHLPISMTANAWNTCATLWKTANVGSYTTKLYALIKNSLTTSDSAQFRNANTFDLTAMFGSAIADYVYTLESGTARAGIAWLKANGFFNSAYYPYDAGTLKSVETFAHPFKDSNGKIIGYFPMNFDLELRGIPKLDANNVLYYDGDEYDGNGTVTRKYGIRAYTSGDATDGSTMITDGTNTVYKLATPTTETV